MAFIRHFNMLAIFLLTIAPIITGSHDFGQKKTQPMGCVLIFEQLLTSHFFRLLDRLFVTHLFIRYGGFCQNHVNNLVF